MHRFDQYGFMLIASDVTAISLLDCFVAIAPESSESQNWEVWEADVKGVRPGQRPSAGDYVPTNKLFEFNLPGEIDEESALAVITAMEHAYELGRDAGVGEMARAHRWAMESMQGSRDPEELLEAARDSFHRGSTATDKTKTERECAAGRVAGGFESAPNTT